MAAARPTVTALRAERRARVAVELDGERWRVLPAEAVVRAGLAVGQTLDRPALRLLRRELRRAEAFAVAGQTLRARDVSSARLRERLERAAVTPDVSAEALAVLQRTGLVDDARFAGNRAAALADRGYGDAAIRLDLERQSVAADLIAEAVGALDPEIQRARELVSRRGEGPRTARYVAGRGFGEDAVSAALGDDFASDP